MSTAAADASRDTLVIDPVRMNILNRLASGCALAGELQFKGGLLLQGSLDGQGEIHGRLVIWHSGRLAGRFRVLGDLYVLGRLGATGETPEATDDDTTIECLGTAYVAATGIVTGHLVAPRLRLYEGATLHGPFRTLKRHEAPPVLQPGTVE